MTDVFLKSQSASERKRVEKEIFNNFYIHNFLSFIFDVEKHNLDQQNVWLSQLRASDRQVHDTYSIDTGINTLGIGIGIGNLDWPWVGFCNFFEFFTRMTQNWYITEITAELYKEILQSF